MPSPESNHEIPQQYHAAGEVYQFFSEMQVKNPEFMKGLLDRLWSRLPPEEKDARTAANAALFPEDMVGRENSHRAHLLAQYMRDEQTLAAFDLETVFDLEAAGPSEADAGSGLDAA